MRFQNISLLKELSLEQLLIQIFSYKKRNEEVKSKPGDFEQPADLDTAIEQIQNLKTYIETTSKELNINFNFNGNFNIM